MREKGLKLGFWSFLALAVALYFYLFLPVLGISFNKQRHANPPLRPAWELEGWLWEDAVNTSEYVDELLAGYKENDIPDRTILLDSPWFKKGKYHYIFGDDLLIAPIYIDSKIREISLSAGKWSYFFDDKGLLEGPLTFEKKFPIEKFSVFVKERAIIPLAIKQKYNGLGDVASNRFVTILIFQNTHHSFTYHHPRTNKQTKISYRSEKMALIIRIEGQKSPII